MNNEHANRQTGTEMKTNTLKVWKQLIKSSNSDIINISENDEKKKSLAICIYISMLCQGEG